MSGEDLSTQPFHDRIQPISATEMIRLERQYLSSGRVREADALFQRALSLHPRDAEAWHGRGLVATSQGRHEVAAVCFRKAISCNTLCFLLALTLQIRCS